MTFNADLRELDLGRYDFISCIAAIHHLPFAETVTRLANALVPGGVLAIIGLNRPTYTDLALSVVAFWPNRARILAGRSRGSRTARNRRSWSRT